MNGYKVNSPVGEYGILYASNSAGTPIPSDRLTNGFAKCGLIFYQAGIMVLSSSVFMSSSHGLLASSCNMDGTGNTIQALITGSTVDENANRIRTRMINVSFNNTTELNSTIYFCRINHQIQQVRQYHQID